MKALLLPILVGVSEARTAHAFAACNNNFGLAPKTKTGATISPARSW